MTAGDPEDLESSGQAPSRRLFERAVGWAGLASVLVVWELCVRLRLVAPLILPPPSAVGREVVLALANIARGDYMLTHTLTTLGETLAGFALAVAIGFGLGVLIAEVPTARRVLMPYLISLNAAPKIALAPLLIVWFGFGMASKVVMAALIAFFPLLVNVVSGLANVDDRKLKLMQSLAASKWKVFTKVKLPDALPTIFAGGKTAIVLAVVGAVVGEFVGADAGLGHLIKKTEYQLDVAVTFAAIVLLSVAGILLFYALELLERRLLFWTQVNR